MISTIKPVETIYWIARDPKRGTLHHGVIDQGLELATGQPELEQFKDEKAFLTRLKEFDASTDTVEFKTELTESVTFVKSVASKLTEVVDVKSK